MLHSRGGRRRSARTCTNTHARIHHQRDKKSVQLMATDAVNTTSAKADDRGSTSQGFRAWTRRKKERGGGEGDAWHVSLNNKEQLRQRGNLASPTKAARTKARRKQLEPFFFFLFKPARPLPCVSLLPPAPAEY